MMVLFLSPMLARDEIIPVPAVSLWHTHTLWCTTLLCYVIIKIIFVIIARLAALRNTPVARRALRRGRNRIRPPAAAFSVRRKERCDVDVDHDAFLVRGRCGPQRNRFGSWAELKRSLN